MALLRNRQSERFRFAPAGGLFRNFCEEFAFGLQPVLQVTSVNAAALEKKLISAQRDFVVLRLSNTDGCGVRSESLFPSSHTVVHTSVIHFFDSGTGELLQYRDGERRSNRLSE